MTRREEALDLDARDPLGPRRDAFRLPDGLIYLDGNSLGPLTHAARAALDRAIDVEWGEGLIGSWTLPTGSTCHDASARASPR